ncbi:CHAT domain-containing protein [Micromonospora carbonacea]|uniref:Tetratricopeptide repeat-containing protein n=1 Tax=Micromonospora carbonacea TaxID=47853 RepID=A0A1C4YIQ5_9ACTN|nr:CHAT domain-containing protein [Micromonospora carbonacea]SCF20594.1 Tetratricopeptide repeat-containing protein [Micromonospora carbonacea]
MREQLVEAILARFEEARRTGDYAAVLTEDALEEANLLQLRVSGPASTPDLPVDVVALTVIGRLHLLRFRARHGAEDMEGALLFLGEVYRVAPDSLPDQVRQLFDHTPEITESDDSVFGYSDDPDAYTKQGGALYEWYEEHGDVEALEAAVRVYRAAVGVADRARNARCLRSLHTALVELARATGDLEAAREAADVARTLAESGTDVASPTEGGATRLANLSDTLRVEFTRTGDEAVINDSIATARAAVNAAENDEERGLALTNLAASLEARYEYLNDREALRESVDVGRAAIAADPDLLPTVANQAVFLRELFLRTKEAALLNESLAAHARVLRATPDTHASLHSRLMNAANTLRVLYRWTEDPSLVQDAVEIMADEAVKEAGLGEVALLADALVDLADRTGDEDILREAIATCRMVLAELANDEPLRGDLLYSLSIALHELTWHNKDPHVLREVLDTAREAVGVDAEDDVDLARRMTHLGFVLRHAFEVTREHALLAEARTALIRAMALTTPDIVEQVLGDREKAVAAVVEDDRVMELWILERTMIWAAPKVRGIHRAELVRLAGGIGENAHAVALELAREFVTARDSLMGSGFSATERSNLITALRERLTAFGDTRDADEVLVPEALDELVDLLCAVPDPLDDVEVTQTAGLLLLSRVEAHGTPEGAAELMMVALDLLAPLYRMGGRAHVPTLIAEQFDKYPPAAPDSAATLGKLGRVQYRDADTDPDALDRAVRLFRRAIDHAENGHAELPHLRTNLGTALMTKFDRDGDQDDLDEAVEECQAAVEDAPPDAPIQAMCLSNLGITLLTRAGRLGSRQDLENAVAACQAAVDGWPDHPDIEALKTNLDTTRRTLANFLDHEAGLSARIDAASDPGELSDLLWNRFIRTGDLADLDRAVRVRQDAGDAGESPAEHLEGLCDLLRDRFVHSGRSEDLNASIAAGRAAIEATPPGDPELAGRRSTLAIALSQRYQNGGAPEDLDESIRYTRDAMASDTEPSPTDLSNLCLSLRLLFERTDRIEHVNEAVEAGRAAVGAALKGTPLLGVYLGNFGGALLARFRRTSGQVDLDEAIDALRRSVSAMSAVSYERGMALANLSSALYTRFDCRQDRADLDEAIDTGRQAVMATSPDHTSRALRLSNLAAFLLARFSVGDAPADLDEALEVCRAAVEALAPGDPRRAPALLNLTQALLDLHDRTGRREPLDDAVDGARKSLAELPVDHPDRPLHLLSLGRVLRRRNAVTGTDLEAVLAAVREAASTDVGAPRVRAVAAAEWAGLAASDGRWAEAAEAYGTAVDLVGRTVSRSLTWRDREALIDGMAGLGADAAACCVRAGLPTRAVELFEQGRGLLLGHALDSRTDLTALAERQPAFATMFTELCAAFEDPDTDATTRRGLAARYDRLLANIRTLPGFDTFLRPPTVCDLAPAEGHAVVVVVSDFGSYALILSAAAEVTPVPLPALTPRVVMEEVLGFLQAVEDTRSGTARARAAGRDRVIRTLEWIWDAVAGPVLDHLGGAERLWWCPSGMLSLLPLHAAGYHGTGSLTVVDRVVCSTTPTLRALVHSRRGTDPARPRADRALVVAMPRTPGHDVPLPGAEREAAVVRTHLPGAVDVVSGTAATRDTVLTALPKAQIAHFACHGNSDLTNPSESLLLLADHHNHPLTALDLAHLRLDAELAFLSACSTARPGGRLADEVIHLASAFQMAGYRHVIGTLWPIGDQPAVDFAELVYPAIAAGGDIATAVHTATRTLRDRHPDDPLVWASHVHVGA